jgi:hypothetical protein
MYAHLVMMRPLYKGSRYGCYIVLTAMCLLSENTTTCLYTIKFVINVCIHISFFKVWIPRLHLER